MASTDEAEVFFSLGGGSVALEVVEHCFVVWGCHVCLLLWYVCFFRGGYYFMGDDFEGNGEAVCDLETWYKGSDSQVGES